MVQLLILLGPTQRVTVHNTFNCPGLIPNGCFVYHGHSLRIINGLYLHCTITTTTATLNTATQEMTKSFPISLMAMQLNFCHKYLVNWNILLLTTTVHLQTSQMLIPDAADTAQHLSRSIVIHKHLLVGRPRKEKKWLKNCTILWVV